MSENVLLLCLSKVDFSHDLTKYKYNGLDETIEGYMTNEAPAKVVLSMVDHLDRIVAICSEEVRYKNIPRIGTSEKDDKIRKYIMDDSEFPINDMDQFEKYLELKYTHYDYYKAVISKYATEKGKKPPYFYSIDISNNPAEYEIAEVAVKAADLIMRAPMSDQNNEGQSDCEEQLNVVEQKKDIHLYIDYNGGQRYIASMLLNTANLIEQNGAKIEDVFTMNFDNKIEIDGEKYVAVENFMAVLQSARLVSGIKEYEDYGRCKELKKYFDNCGDEEITQIITNMEELSHCLQMCDTDKIFSKKNEGEKTLPQALRESLNNYASKNDKDLKEKGAQSILFKYVAEDILNGYRPLFDGDLLDIIDWCRENDYIQQAVTFYAERMPVYFWDKEIFCPTTKEEAEYKKIDDACKYIKNSNDTKAAQFSHLHMTGLQMEPESYYSYLKRNYLNYNWKYSWMVKYLYYSDGKDGKREDDSQDFFEWMGNCELRRQRISYRRCNLDNLSRSKDTENLSTNTKRVYSAYVYNGTGDDPYDKMQKLREILSDYNNIKEQRNNINHAEDTEDYSGRWSYEETINNLEKYIENIRKFMKVDNHMS